MGSVLSLLSSDKKTPHKVDADCHCACSESSDGSGSQAKTPHKSESSDQPKLSG